MIKGRIHLLICQIRQIQPMLCKSIININSTMDQIIGLKIRLRIETGNLNTRSWTQDGLETDNMARGQNNPQTGKQFHNWTPGVDRPGYNPFSNNRQRFLYGNSIENEDGFNCSEVNNVAAINTITPQECTGGKMLLSMVFLLRCCETWGFLSLESWIT